MSCSYTKFIGSTMLSDKEEIVKLLCVCVCVCVCVCKVVLGPKSAIDQFVEMSDRNMFSREILLVLLEILFILSIERCPDDSGIPCAESGALFDTRAKETHCSASVRVVSSSLLSQWVKCTREGTGDNAALVSFSGGV